MSSFSYELPGRLIGQTGDLYMCCSDYPHSEGTATPVADYVGSAKPVRPVDAPGLFGENVSMLLATSHDRLAAQPGATTGYVAAAVRPCRVDRDLQPRRVRDRVRDGGDPRVARHRHRRRRQRETEPHHAEAVRSRIATRHAVAQTLRNSSGGSVPSNHSVVSTRRAIR